MPVHLDPDLAEEVCSLDVMRLRSPYLKFFFLLFLDLHLDNQDFFIFLLIRFIFSSFNVVNFAVVTLVF